MCLIWIFDKNIHFWKERKEEWKGFMIVKDSNGTICVFTGDKDGEAEKVVFVKK